ncbi:SusD/RagB family nutrient-binding outer membrane lipoprotein [Chryseolinea lacunae]|uniref:SusD/RagB family nutrient-binding outer membrane lipoprotein n=1 Tax=Chryseolinea lacunae TaxID=2801331 RepID=A0ABS1KYX4_9BACT|nr:SusD/RagB family nutrient-binding outer membrane lipoprotein [Chryseolinea lacunae]MBL0744432.1 SusD/RagB family nutrient-binding outer membrane lipoprotein [Chryseolinea lacunae]
MKTNRYTKWIAVALTVVLLMRCESFDEMNQNPTTSTNMDPNIMLSTIQLQLSGSQFEALRNGFIYSGHWMQQWTGEYSSTEYGGKCIRNEAYMSALWVTQYSREIKNIVDMVESTRGDAARVNINSVSRIMKVYIFSRLTDLYGDIPYFNAAKGYYTGTYAPEYDSQEAIYNDFFKELDEATKAIDATKDKVTSDYYFEGDLAKWKKFGNSLRLRLALRLTKRDEGKAKTEAEAAIAGGVMTSTADMATMKHTKVSWNGGTFGGNAVSYVFMNQALDAEKSLFRICTTFVDHLVSTGDPRLRLLAGSYLEGAKRPNDITDQVLAKVGSYHAMALPPSYFTYEANQLGGAVEVTVAGAPVQVTREYQSLQPSRWISEIEAPYIMMSYAEVELWLAEAAFRTWNTGATAAQHYANALEAGVKEMTVYGAPEVAQNVISDFVADNALTAGQELKQINTALWVEFALNGQEAYANWRRSGFPALVYPNRDPGVNESNGQIPRRMQYPQEEFDYNTANVRAAVALLPAGKDDWTSPVWWDKQ